MTLNRPNRRGTDPYARWCGRGDIARCPPIPISFHRRLRGREAQSPFIEVSKTHGSKDNVPDPVINFLEANLFAGEDLADGDVLLMPVEAAVLDDAAHLEMGGIFERRHARRDSARRCEAALPGAVLRERFVGTLMVVLASKTVEPALLGDRRCRGRLGGFSL